MPGWQEETIILLDGATYHKSDETKDAFTKLGFKVIYSGPYSYSTAPIKLMFGVDPGIHLTRSRYVSA